MKTTLMTVEETLVDAFNTSPERTHSIVFLYAPNLAPSCWGLVRKAEEERVQDRQGMGVPGMENPCNSLL